jgi:ABC-type cobalamin/Fe3+-siderophores transport system ATPase subunit
MTFQLHVDRISAEPLTISIAPGEALFVLGANGTGKSSLLQRLAATSGGNARRISASRQTWFQSSALEFTPAQRQNVENQVRSWDSQSQSRWMEQDARMRSGLTLYDLIDAENVDARAIADAMRAGNVSLATDLASKTAPIAKINELLGLSNIPITISVSNGDRLMASKNGGIPYGAAELSDGERNALLIAADVLTARSGSLLIIDEPERHLHRSIISPLLTHLFRCRPDNAFVVATHDLMLPVDNPDARTLLIRGCSYEGSNPRQWDVDLIPANANIEESIKRDIVGSRRQIVFVEGEDQSLDKPLYIILFPMVSVCSKGSSRDVHHSVNAIRTSESLHWLQAWGIIDSDGRNKDSVVELRSIGVFPLPFYSVESIYFHPDLVFAVAHRQASVLGTDGNITAKNAIAAAIAAVEPHIERLAARAVEKSIRRSALEGLPTLKQIEQKQPVSITIDTANVVDQEAKRLADAAKAGDWLHILTRCPVRETQALDAIARAVGLRGRQDYIAAVLKLLREDERIRQQTRAMFGGLAEEIG